MKPNIIKLSDDELFVAHQDFNHIFGYLKGGFKRTHNKEQQDYLENESTFKKVLDQINKMSEEKFKVKKKK